MKTKYKIINLCLMLFAMCAVSSFAQEDPYASFKVSFREQINRFTENVFKTNSFQHLAEYKNKLILKTPNNYGELLHGLKWKSVRIKEPRAGKKYNNCIEFIYTNSASIRVDIRSYLNTSLALTNVIQESFMFKMSSRMWEKKGADNISMPGVSFMIYYTGEYPSRLRYSIYNINVLLVDLWLRAEDICLVTSNQMNLVIKQINTIFSDKHAKINNSNATQLNYTYKAEKHIVNWSVEKSFKDHWIRMDCDEGELTIQKEGSVLIENVPAAGTKVHCYAISPDGTKWYKTSIKIEPKVKKFLK